LPKRNSRSPRRNGKNLGARLKKVGPHNEDSHRLNIEDNIMINGEIMLTRTLFLVPEEEEEAEEESSHVLHVGRMDIKPLIVQTANRTKEKLTSLRRTGMMLRMRTPEVESH
jgi:hypothetical protein